MHVAAVIVRLQELLVALDRRRVQPDRATEVGIAKDASEMRSKAVVRLAELQSDAPSADLFD